MKEPPESSYGRILKSTALLGGSSVVNIALGALRTKILAVQLGPALFGVMGLYSSLTVMIQSVASLGLGQSAVREIAAAAGSHNQIEIAQTITAYRRVVMVTGLVGLLATVLLAYPASLVTFKNDRHVWSIAALSVVVLMTELQAGQTALLQGMRRIGDITALTITGAVWSTALAIPILLMFRERGIVPFLIAVALGQMIASWWYARRVKVEKVSQSWADTWRLSRSMLSLGLSFVATGMAASISLYAIRLIISRQLGEASVGLYQSAFTLSGIYVSFVLQAMGGDYYPRLAGVGDDTAKRNLLVNEQTKAAILLAAPGLVAALVFSEPLIHAMYSARFAGASEILRWQVLGLLGRAIAWPMGFILLARGDSRAFMATELLSALAHVAFVWAGVAAFGAPGAGMAFALLYFCYGAAMWLIVRLRHGYVCSHSTATILATGSLAVGVAFALTFIASPWLRAAAGGTVLLVTGSVSMEMLAALAPSTLPARIWSKARRYTPIPRLRHMGASARRGISSRRPGGPE